MTVQELHIEIEQKLQEQGSYKRDRIYPEAIDLALREAEESIIRNAIDDRFADKETRMTRIRPLLLKNVAFPAYISGQSEADYEPDMVYMEFPANLQYLVNARVKVVKKKDCTNISATVAPKVLYRVQVKFPDTTLTSGPIYNNFTIFSSSQGVIYQAPSVFNGRFFAKDQKYEIAANVVDKFNKVGSNIEAYWESYDNSYLPNTFTFYSQVPLGIITIAIYRPDNTTQEASSIANETLIQRVIVDPSSLTNPALVTSISPTRTVEPDILYKALKLNSFTKTKAREPLAVESNFNYYIYKDQSFLVSNVYIDYIRKPQQISLLLNQTSELDSALHWEIVNKAVEILQLNIKDPAANSTIQYNELQSRNN